MSETRGADLSAIGLLDEPVRRRLYDWVVAQGREVGREEAARAVGVSRALATFHLDRLAEKGQISAVPRAPRPTASGRRRIKPRGDVSGLVEAERDARR
jgi:DNA-binding transcriptional ArsR family regulator